MELNQGLGRGVVLLLVALECRVLRPGCYCCCCDGGSGGGLLLLLLLLL